MQNINGNDFEEEKKTCLIVTNDIQYYYQYYLGLSSESPLEVLSFIRERDILYP